VELLLLRHAIAFERNPRRWPDDGNRPLSPRGTERGRQAALGVRRLLKRPQRVLVSPLLRTRETAAILTRFAGWPRAAVCEQLRPGTPPEELLAELARVRAPQVAVVGHEPDLSELLTICLGARSRGAFALRKSGVAVVEFSGRPAAGRGRLVAFLPPKLLRALA